MYSFACRHNFHGSESDFFREPLSEQDSTLKKLLVQPSNRNLFCEMSKVCVTAIISVLERQYKCYFEMNISEQLRRPETESCRLHNIDAEEIMGMFSASKQFAKHATMCFLSSRMRAMKNHTSMGCHLKRGRKYLSGQLVQLGKRHLNRKKHVDLRQELSKRAAQKRQKREEKEKVESKLKTLKSGECHAQFPELGKKSLSDLEDMLAGAIVAGLTWIKLRRPSTMEELRN